MENKYDMPIGLSFQLGLNEKALSVYAQMDESEKKQVVEAARNVTSKAECSSLYQNWSAIFCEIIYGLQIKKIWCGIPEPNLFSAHSFCEIAIAYRRVL